MHGVAQIAGKTVDMISSSCVDGRVCILFPVLFLLFAHNFDYDIPSDALRSNSTRLMYNCIAYLIANCSPLDAPGARALCVCHRRGVGLDDVENAKIIETHSVRSADALTKDRRDGIVSLY